MRLSKLAVWNSLWLVLFAGLSASVWWLSTGGTTLDFDDWPDGDTSDKDRWRSGVFLGVHADRIRRVGRWRGDYLDAKSVSFYVSIPMAQPEFDSRLREWQARSDFESRRVDGMFRDLPPHLPKWFPRPSPDIYVGTLTDPSNWRVSIFRRPNDDYLYLRL